MRKLMLRDVLLSSSNNTKLTNTEQYKTVIWEITGEITGEKMTYKLMTVGWK